MTELLRITDAAAQLGVSKNTVYRMIGDGRLAALHHGGKSWVEPQAIDDYFARLRMEGAKRRQQKARTPHSSNRGRTVAAVAG